MKGKKINLILTIIAVCLFAMITAAASLFLIQSINVKKTGNVLGVSWYNEEDSEFVISTKEELVELSQLSRFYSFEGQTIKLGADIVLNEGEATEWLENAPKNQWSPITNFAGTFEGQNHRISGVYIKNYNSNSALFVNTSNKCLIKEVFLVNSFFDITGAKGAASFVSGGGGTFIGLYSDAIFEHEGQECGGIASSITDTTIIEECCFDGTIYAGSKIVGGILSVADSPRVEIKHTLFSGKIVHDYSKYEYSPIMGGICGQVNSGGGLILSDSLASGNVVYGKNGQIASVIGATVSGSDTLINDAVGSRAAGPKTIASQEGSVTGGNVPYTVEQLKGVNAYKWTNLDFENYWNAIENESPILKRFSETGLNLEGIEKAFDTSWYDSERSSFVIENKEQLYGFWMLAASTNFANKTIKLGADIALNSGNAKDYQVSKPENEWYPVSSSTLPFAGTFDGQKHTISGIYISEKEEPYVGFFRYVGAKGVVKALKITNSYYETQVGNVGSVTGRLAGTIESCYSDAVLSVTGEDSPFIGGIAGMAYHGSKNVPTIAIRDCWYDGEIILAGNTQIVGGILGAMHTYSNPSLKKMQVSVKHCLYTGMIRTASESETTVKNVGGIFGNNMTGMAWEIDDCLNAGDIDIVSNKNVGAGLANAVGLSKYVPYITNVYAVEGEFTPIKGVGTQNTVNGGVAVMPVEWMTGKAAYQYSSLDFENYWTTVNNGTPMLKTFATKTETVGDAKKLADISWYDPTKTEYVIDSTEDLYGLYVVSTFDHCKGKTIKLTKDITVNQGDANTWSETAPEKEIRSLFSLAEAFMGTFDGQGHTISGLYIHEKERNRVGFISYVYSGATVKNLKIVNSYYETQVGNVGSIAGQLTGTIESCYSDAVLSVTGEDSPFIGGIAGMAYHSNEKFPTIGISDCWYEGEIILAGNTQIVGGILGGMRSYSNPSLKKMQVSVKHCLYTGMIRTASESETTVKNVGGIFGNNMTGMAWEIDDCLNAGDIDIVSNKNVGAGLANAVGLSKYVPYITNVYAVEGEFTPIKGVGTQNTVNGGVAVMPVEWMTGKAAYQYSSLDFENYWTTVNNGTPMLKTFATKTETVGDAKKLADISWYDPTKTEYVIDSTEDLYGLYVVSTFDHCKGKTIKLTKDITVNQGDANTWSETAPEKEIRSLYSLAEAFMGTFDGQGHTISGIYIKTNKQMTGLFGTTHSSAIVKDVRLENSYLESTNTGEAIIGSIVGRAQGTLKNVYSNATIKSAGYRVGGLIGMGTNLAIESCAYEGNITVNYTGKESAFTGGVMGFPLHTSANKGVSINNCLVSGIISVDFVSTDEAREGWGACVGGFVGSDRGRPITIANCIAVPEIHVQWHHNDLTGSTAPVAISQVKSTMGSMTSEESSVAETVYTSIHGSTYVEDKNTTTQITDVRSVLSLMGAQAFYNTELDYGEEWVLREEKTPIPRTLVSSQDTVINAIALKKPDVSWYDADEEDLYIFDEADFLGFSKLASEGKTFAGQKIYLMANLEINEVGENTIASWKTGTVPHYVWTPVGSETTPFKGTFNGQGHTICGIFISTEANCVGLFGLVSGGTIKNFSLVDSYINETGNGVFIGSIVGYMSGGTGKISNVYSSAEIESNGTEFGGIAGRVSGTVENCWFDGQLTSTKGSTGRISCGGIVGTTLSGDKVTIQDCLNTGNINYASTVTNSNADDGNAYVGIGGIYGRQRNASTVTIKNCVSVGKITTSHKLGVGAVMGASMLTGSVNNISNCYTANNCISSKNASEVSIIGYCNKNVTTTTETGNLVLEPSALLGKQAFHNTALDFVNAWTTRDNNVPVPKTLTDDSVKLFRADRSWYNTTDKEFTIYDEEDFYGLAAIVNTNSDSFAGKTIKLAADLELNEVNEDTITSWKAGSVADNTWTPIGTTYSFCGTFDGQGHTIRGVYMKTDAQIVGLFGNVKNLSGYSNCCIKNFRLEDSYFESTNTGEAILGSIAGWAEGTLQDIYSSATIQSAGYRVGGLTGMGSNLTIESCAFEGELAVNYTGTSRAYVGGFMGFPLHTAANTGININNCLVSGKIDVDVTYTGTDAAWGASVGGFVGDTYSRPLTITNSIAVPEMNVTLRSTQAVELVQASPTIGFNRSSSGSVENVYTAVTGKTYAVTANITTSISGNLELKKLLGENARTNASGLDYTNAWTIRTGKVPMPTALMSQ